MTDLVSVEKFEQYAVCTLSLPEKRNPISHKMRAAIRAALEPLGAQKQVRAVIITGAGSAFCSGLDLEGLAKQAALSHEEHLADSRDIADFFKYIYSYPKPTIAAVNGPAVAGGLGLAVLCDFTLASAEAWFSLSEVKIGFVPAIIGVYLERLIGAKRSRDIMLSGRRVSAQEAAAMGLVNAVVPASELMTRAAALAAELAQNGPQAVQTTKMLLAHCAGETFEEAVNLAVKSNADARGSEECREGVKAFLEKRQPGWR